MKFTIGSDPELFLVDKDKNFVNAYNYLGGQVKGTKEKPEATEYGAIQVDGMAIELNTKPTIDREEFSDMLEDGLTDVKKRFPDLDISTECVQKFSKEFLKNQPSESVILGCDPDYSAYRLQQNQAPNPEHLFRTAGGHIHIGWTEGVSVDSHQHLEMCAKAVKQLEVLISYWSTAVEPPNDRTNLYGNYGCFRPKHYGVEYRTPSNFWLFNPDYRQEIFDRCAVGMQLLADGKELFNSASLNNVSVWRQLAPNSKLLQEPETISDSHYRHYKNYLVPLIEANETYIQERSKLHAAS